MGSAYQVGKAGGTGSPMIGMINRAIDDDIKAQVQDFSIEERGVAKKKNLLAHYQQKLGSNEKAVQALKMRAYEDAIGQIQLSNAKKKAPLAKLQGEQAIVQLTAQHEAAKAAYAKTSLTDRIKLQKEMREEDKYRKSTLTNIRRGGRVLHANNPGEAKSANLIEAGREKAKSSIHKMTSLMNKYDAIDYINPSSQLKEDMMATTRALRATFRIMLVGPGTISDADRETLKEAISDPDGFSDSIMTSRGAKKYNALLKQYMSDTEIDLKHLLPNYSTKQQSMGMQKGAVKVGG